LQLAYRSLESEAHLRVDAAIVSRIACTKTAETAGRRSRLAEQQRTQIANRVSKIGVVKYVVEIQRECQAIAATGVSTTTTKTSATTAAEAASAATTTASSTAAAALTAATATSHAAAHHRRTLSIISLLVTLVTLVAIPLICLCARRFRTKGKGFAYA
jgi:hypothetical protein